MPEALERALRLSPKVFYLLGFFALLLAAFAAGLLLGRVFKRYAGKLQGTWGEVLFSILEPLPVPLLLLTALYTGLEVLTLPRQYERLGANLISCLVILVVCYFPARVVIVFVGRVGHRKPELEPTTRFIAAITRALFVLLALYTALEVLELPRKTERLGSKLAAALAIALVFYALAKMVVLYLGRLSLKEPALVRVTQPAAFVARLLFALLAAIIILENLGIHLTAVWTTLGVGSVAVALALQETLSNLLAGLYLLADRRRPRRSARHT
jgi:small-conductance mechanosensitive channel